MSAICIRHDKTTLLVTKGDNGHFAAYGLLSTVKDFNTITFLEPNSAAKLIRCKNLTVEYIIIQNPFFLSVQLTQCPRCYSHLILLTVKL